MKRLPAAGQIQALFDDLPAFAAMAAAISPEVWRTVRFDFFRYPLGLFWLGVRREQAGPREAFAALFVLDLHFQNEWPCDEKAAGAPLEQWEALLRERWLPEYFSLKRRSARVTPRDVDAFRRSLLQWAPENAPAGELAALEKILSGTRWVCSLFPDAFYDQYFGETEEYFFLAESGVYD